MVQIKSQVPESRVQVCNEGEVREDGGYVLYWMIAHRRLRSNFSLERAADWAESLGKPLLILEALRCGYRWASDRIHAFVLQGMADNRAVDLPRGVGYHPYVEMKEGEGSGLLEALAEKAAVVVTDDFPCFFLPRMVAAASEKLSVRLEAVDSNGLYPMRATDRVFLRAVDFRRHLQKNLPEHFADMPLVDPLADRGLPAFDGLPEEVTERWPAPSDEVLEGKPEALERLPIDHAVPPVSYRGGSQAAREHLERFLEDRLDNYEDGRRDVVDRATSELSPYLHFGHVSAHEVFAAVAEREDWNPQKTAGKANGSRSGWWGMSSPAESFLDELVTWRELGYNMCAAADDYETYDSLPEWARETLEEHERDPRPDVYTLKEFEEARTHDPIWNAAQGELVRDGRIHNYLRMLWGKKILEWSATPKDALEVMIELNNKYGVDGRNPNSYSGIFWCLGRYDRPWGPEREIFGKIRFMSSDSTRRKLDAKAYVEEFGGDAQKSLL